jgi:hypothetical protein
MVTGLHILKIKILNYVFLFFIAYDIKVIWLVISISLTIYYKEVLLIGLELLLQLKYELILFHETQKMLLPKPLSKLR